MSIVDIDADDPFAGPDRSAPSGVITGGRYRLPRRDGTHKSGGWQRVSNLASAISDQFALRIWEIEQGLCGVGLDDALYASLRAEIPRWRDMERQDRKRAIEAFLERCKAVTGADIGSRHGNHRHAIVEEFHEDVPWAAHWTAAGRRDVALYAAALARHRLQAMPGMQERIVLVEELEAAGRIDNILQDLLTGALHIGDLKTTKKFWTYLEIKTQLACYANAAAMWDAEAGKWVDMPPVSREIALALWMPRETEDGEPRVDVLEVPIVEGWRTALFARQVVLERKAGRTGARLRPAPPVTDTERWAARFAAVETVHEGSRLVAEARAAGVWSDALAQSAKVAAERVSRARV